MTRSFRNYKHIYKGFYNKMTYQVTHVERIVFDALDEIAFNLRESTDEELVSVIRRLIRQRTDRVSALIKFAEDHGGAPVAARVKRLLKQHYPYGSGEHLWTRVLGNRLVLVEGSNA